MNRWLPILLLPALLVPAARAYDDNDFHTWIDVYAVRKIDARWSLRAEEELKFGDDSSDFYYRHTDAGASWKAGDRLLLGLNYRYIDEKKDAGWEHEDRPHANVTLKRELPGFRLEDRNRLEFRMRDGAEDSLRYRNRVLILCPATLLGRALTPYVSEEAFIDTDRGDFNQFRTAAGVRMKLGASLEADLYYLWMTTEKSTDWTDTNFLGVSVGCVL
jgi:hypothetical protein